MNIPRDGGGSHNTYDLTSEPYSVNAGKSLSPAPVMGRAGGRERGDNDTLSPDVISK